MNDNKWLYISGGTLLLIGMLLAKRSSSTSTSTSNGGYPNPSGTARGYRNNNPGNIIQSSTTYTGEIQPSTDSRFKQFQSMPYGFRALFKLLRVYQTKHNLYTIQQMINRWASGDDTTSYAKHIVSFSNGVFSSPSDKVDLSNSTQALAMATAMARVENGSAPNSSDVRSGYNLYLSSLSGVGRVEYQKPGVVTEIIPTKKAAMLLLPDTHSDGVLNNDLYTRHGEIITSNYLRDKGFPEVLRTKKSLSDALSQIKHEDGGYLFYQYQGGGYYPPVPEDVQRIVSDIVDRIDREGCNDADQAYTYTLYAIANGLRFAWSPKDKSRRGVRQELLATRHSGKADRRAVSQILNDSTGITPEELSERIAGYSGDSSVVKEGVLDAIRDSGTPNGAWSRLYQMYSSQLDNQDTTYDPYEYEVSQWHGNTTKDEEYLPF